MFNYATYPPENLTFVEIGPADLPNGERMFLEIDGQPIVVFNIAGQYYAIADMCSHEDAPLGDGDLDAFHITCLRHGAEFDVRNGKAMTMPAVVDIPAYPVQVREGVLWLGVPKDR
jgi:3-phenylpropionate/trans-cinnamate dioxygenase ferredoxin subunit